MTLSIVLYDPFSLCTIAGFKAIGMLLVCGDILLISLLSIIANSDHLDQNPLEYGALAWHHLLGVPCVLWEAQWNDDREISASTDSFVIQATDLCCKY